MKWHTRAAAAPAHPLHAKFFIIYASGEGSFDGSRPRLHSATHTEVAQIMDKENPESCERILNLLTQ